MHVAAALLALLASALFAAALVAQHVAASDHLGKLVGRDEALEVAPSPAADATGRAWVRTGGVADRWFPPPEPDEARAPATHAVGWGALVRRPLWWAGNAGDVVGYAVQAVALGLGALLVVQPVLASSLLFALALGARVTHRPLARGDAIAAAALAAGVSVFLLVANPSVGRDTASVTRWLPSAGPLLVLLFAAIAGAWCVRGPLRATCFGMAAGLLYGATGVFTKTVVDHLHAGPVAVLTSWDTYGLSVAALTGTVFQQLALAAGPLSASLPAITVLEPLVASALGVTVLQEHLRAGLAGSVIAAAAAAVMAAAVWHLARSPMIGAEVASERRD